MRMFLQPRPMSIQKPSQKIVQRLQKVDRKKNHRQQDEDYQSVVEASIRPFLKSNNLTGVNSTIQTYCVMEKGTSGGSLWTLNLSTLPSGHKRFLSLLAGSTFLVNYAMDSYPSKINVLIDQVTPSLDGNSSPSHTVGILVPQGAATSIVNPGNIVGFNVSYKNLGVIPAVDITGLPLLTFDITADENTPANYPLPTPITLLIQLTTVMF